MIRIGDTKQKHPSKKDKEDCNCNYKGKCRNCEESCEDNGRRPISSNYIIDPLFGIKAYNFIGGRDVAYSVANMRDGYILSGPVAADTTDFGSLKLNKQTGLPDPQFGVNGYVITAFPGNGTRTDVPAVSYEYDNQLFVAGAAQFGLPGTNDLLFAVAKYQSDGRLDNKFGTDINGQFNGQGLVYIDVDPRGVNDEIFGLKVDCKKRLVATGFSNPTTTPGAGPTFNFGTARFLPNGVLDKDFGMNGVVITDFMENNDDRANDVLVLEDNSMIIGGRTRIPNQTNFNYALVKLRENGEVDRDFGRYTGTRHRNISIEKGKVVHNFGDNELIITLLWADRDCNEQSPGRSGKFYAAGRSGTSMLQFILVRYLPNGEVDMSFAPATQGVLRFSFNPSMSSDTLHSAFVDYETGSIYLVGQSSLNGVNRPVIARVTKYGNLDYTFGTNGLMVIPLPPNLTSGFLRDGKLDENRDIILVGEVVPAGSTTADFLAIKLKNVP